MSSIIVGIAGGSASGKSELAKFMAAQLSGAAVIISQDWYYHDRSALSDAEQRELNFDHPNAFDHALLQQHLISIKSGRATRAPHYDYVTHERTEEGMWVQPADVILLEGLLVLHEPELRAVLDYSVFVDVPADIRLIRRLRRDAEARGIPMEETLRLYEHCVRPMHEAFVQPSARHASVVWEQERDLDVPMQVLEWIRELHSRARESNSVASRGK